MYQEYTTKERILRSAYQLFIQKGYNGCSMRDIAKETGVQVSSLYNHFPGKEQIFEAVFSEKHPMYRILSILNSVKGDTTEDLVTKATRKLRKELLAEPGLLKLFFIELVEMDGKHLQTAIESNFPRGTQFLQQIMLNDDMREIRGPVFLRSLLAFILSTYLFELFMGKVDSKSWGSQKELLDIYLNGILK